MMSTSICSVYCEKNKIMDFFACYTTIITDQWRLYTCYTCFLFSWAVVVAFNSWRLTPTFNFIMVFSSFCPYNFMKHKMIVEFGFTLICLLLGSLLSRKFNFLFLFFICIIKFQMRSICEYNKIYLDGKCHKWCWGWKVVASPSGKAFHRCIGRGGI